MASKPPKPAFLKDMFPDANIKAAKPEPKPRQLTNEEYRSLLRLKVRALTAEEKAAIKAHPWSRSTNCCCVPGRAGGPPLVG